MITWLAGAALAQTVAVTTRVEGPYATESTVQSAAWHALVDLDHDPVVLERDLTHAPERMRAAGVEVLLDLHVLWHVDLRPTDAGLLPAPFPEVSVTEYARSGGALTPVRAWSRVEPPVVHRDPHLGWFSLPDRALQRAVGAALEATVAGERGDERSSHMRLEPVGPGQAPRPELLLLPVVIAADEEYRARYGDAWEQVAAARVARASELLEPAGFRLRVTGWQGWTSPDGEPRLEGLLEALARAPRHDDTLRVGFTGQPDLTRSGHAEDVGLAYSPGDDLLVGDLRLPELDPAWDLAEEAVVVAHELLHALGVPHTRHPNLLMSESKQSAVHVLSQGTRELARAAVQARHAHWDPLAALEVLAHVAEVRLQAPETQVAYILGNLAAGPGLPAPGQVPPHEVSALANVAMGRHYLERSRAAPQEARALRQSALAHGLAALSEAPALAGPLLAHLEPDPTEPQPPEPACAREPPAPWVVAACSEP